MSEKQKSEAAPPSGFDGAELQLFVSETLKAVIEGIADADNAIAPPARTAWPGGTPMKHTFKFDRPKDVSFDVAVTVTRKGGAKGGLKLEVLSVGANLGGETNREQSVASRVSFSVPVYIR
jgi:hypothetical protein